MQYNKWDKVCGLELSINIDQWPFNWPINDPKESRKSSEWVDSEVKTSKHNNRTQPIWGTWSHAMFIDAIFAIAYLYI